MFGAIWRWFWWTGQAQNVPEPPEPAAFLSIPGNRLFGAQIGQRDYTAQPGVRTFLDIPGEIQRD